MPKLESLTRTPGGKKEFVAVFRQDNERTKTVRFGTSSNYVLNKDKTDAHRAAYIARHRVNEDFSNPMTAGSLSRYILWGNSRSWPQNLAAFRRRFKV